MSEREARLREIRDRVEKATPGPWASWTADLHDPVIVKIPDGEQPQIYDGELDEFVCNLNTVEFRTMWSEECGDGVGLYRISPAEPIAFDGEFPDADFIAHSREDVPWLLAEVERLQDELNGVTMVSGDVMRRAAEDVARLKRELRIEQRRADELDGIGRETRKILDRHQELASIDRDERTPEQTEELISLSRELRGHSEEDQLRAEVLRLRESETYAKLISQRVADENRELRAELEKSKRLQSDIQKSVNRRAEARREKYRRQYVPDWQGTAAFDYPGSEVDG